MKILHHIGLLDKYLELVHLRPYFRHFPQNLAKTNPVCYVGFVVIRALVELVVRLRTLQNKGLLIYDFFYKPTPNTNTHTKHSTSQYNHSFICI